MGGNSVALRPEYRVGPGHYATELHAFWRAPPDSPSLDIHRATHPHG